MEVSKKGLDLIKKYEGFYPKVYLDPVSIPTIGYGIIKYPNGKRVKMSDPSITEKQASDMLEELINKTYAPELNRLLKVKVNQNQFDALVSFIYNLGGSNLSKSTLLSKINKNPNDLSIKSEFLKWNKAGGKVLAGLTKRRKEEAELYFTPVSEVLVKRTIYDLNIREGAGTQYKSLGVLQKGTEVNILNEVDGWAEVFVCSNKIKGWVSNKYIV